jgi:hypothetical protein
MPTYSFGKESPLKFELEPEYADAYNRGTAAFFEAQEFFKKTHGFEWTPEHRLAIRIDQEAMEAFNSFNAHIKKALEKHGRPHNPDDDTDDYLVLND